MELSVFSRFAVALAIGILLGMQREFASPNAEKELAAGVRTFGLLGLVGCLGAMFSTQTNSPWPFVIILLIVGLFFAVNYFIEASHDKPGLTTKVSAILTVLLGALCFWGQLSLSVALAVTAMLLLSLKIQLHAFIRHLTWADMTATLKFAFITAIVLPVLPNRTFGPEPFNIFNPFKFWLVVVFISGISFVGYILMKTVGARKGIGLTGVMGGLASSTAVTLSLTPRSKENPELSKSFAFAIMIAWSIMFLRLFAVIAAVNSGLIRHMAVPMVLSSFVGLAYCLYLYKSKDNSQGQREISLTNPFELGPAIKFGILLIIILFVAKAAQIYFHNAGIYASSLLAGLADVDAISLAMAKLNQGDAGIAATTAVRGIVLATVANTVMKGIIALTRGSAELRRALVPGFILMTLTAAVSAFFV